MMIIKIVVSNKAMDRQMFFKIRATQAKRSGDIDMSNCKMYIVRSLPGMTSFIGWTTQGLSARMKDHVFSYETGKDDGCGDHIETGNARIELIEDYPCESREDARERVRYLKTIFK